LLSDTIDIVFKPSMFSKLKKPSIVLIVPLIV